MRLDMVHIMKPLLSNMGIVLKAKVKSRCVLLLFCLLTSNVFGRLGLQLFSYILLFKTQVMRQILLSFEGFSFCHVLLYLLFFFLPISLVFVSSFFLCCCFHSYPFFFRLFHSLLYCLCVQSTLSCFIFDLHFICSHSRPFFYVAVSSVTETDFSIKMRHNHLNLLPKMYRPRDFVVLLCHMLHQKTL